MSKDPIITIYGAAWCGPCHGLKHYLDSKKIAYKYIDVDKDREAGRKIYEKTKWSAIPVTDIAGEYILGFDLQKINEALRTHQLI